jgi:hypothetical protein
VKSFNFDRVVGISALLISLSTVILLIYEVRLARRSQYAAVMPYVQLRNVETNTPSYKIVLFNDGLGPAFISSIRVIERGKTYEGDLQNFLETGDLKSAPLQYVYSNISSGRLIPAGAELPLISATGDLANSLRISNIFSNDSLEIVIEYKSVFDERWVMSTRRGVIKIE